MSFEMGLKRLLEHEGGYANNPNDTGGETYRGISRRWFPKWAGWPLIDAEADKSKLDDIADLQTMVSNFYYAYFWVKTGCHEIENEAIAEMIFITAVNVGKKVAIKKLQRILKVTQDGVVGPITLKALDEMDPDKFLFQYVLELVDFYLQISKEGNNKVFLRGWLGRAMSFYYSYIK